MKFKLNDNQKEAVRYFDKKPLLIEAGPGSGKTRVLVERIKYLIEEKKLDPFHLFSNYFYKESCKRIERKTFRIFDKKRN